ncbi:MAG TPA: MFS transporter [Thermoplasmata archaeon]|nr:MFS transporter [Thermoplasmata archaeon]
MAVTRRSLAYGLTANVVVLGVVSLFTDISSEMIMPILPFFLIQVLGANALIVGIQEGLADGVVSFMKVFSGRFSDAAGKRKRFVGAGYALSTLMKALFPFAQSWPEFLGMRIVERTGKGVRDAPRDALLTESTPAETRGKAFGFHRSMDTTGAIAGPIITLVLLATIAASPGIPNYRLILLLAAIPAVISVFIVFLVREPVRQRAPKQPLRVTFHGIPKPLWTFIGIASIFSFADFSYAFLLLRAGIHGTTVAILLYVVYNIVYAAHAFPAGILSDRVGRKPVVLTGYIAFIAMATLLVFSDLLAVLVLAFVLYGLSYGMAEGTQRALVADFAPANIKATVLGAYHTCVGAVKLASGVVAGLLWIAFAPTPTFPLGAATFAFGAMAATVAAIGLSLWKAPARS